MKLLFHLDRSSARTGIGFYTQHLVESLRAHPDVTSLVGFSGGEIFQGDAVSWVFDEPSSQTAGLGQRLAPWLRRIPGAYDLRQRRRNWAAARILPAYAKTGYIYHEPNFIPVRYPGKQVITVHDLSHVHQPAFHPPARVAYLNARLGPAMSRADVILTDSHFVAEEIQSVYGVPEERVYVAHLGVSPDFRPRTADETASTRAGFQLRDRGFVLSVATLEPRKNLIRLIDAYARLPSTLRSAYPLVLVGGVGWQNADLLTRVQAMESAGELIRTGYLPQAQVLDLYASAAIFAYPSLYEGFGLPVLEAFASGTPVLTSNVASLPEVSGGAAIEVDPHSIQDIADGLHRLLEDSALRVRIVQQGLDRAQLFSWTRCAEQTLDAYRILS
ncbi:hypothetical protein A9404_09600 [Halothiobacillus diazotrophicus]|uniref:Glycosyl transferase family 1 n=1 Tax=Halothiobacillus diazotrophicus TaxID=1860122 RepID=A0A191ZIB0_9GAMM|nr:glycosyltransferase family 1 protein [Halothiobacillus diazotrophicus]ANJ67605.1 hypothetical protein A9404_09600 [Halothiobacillus diazotrophicus]